MAKQLIIVLLLILPFIVFPQEKDFHVTVNSGISFPTGSFSGTTLGEGSFAQTGWGIDVLGSWTFHKGFGAGLQLAYHAHPVNVVSLAEQKVREDPFLEELVIRSDPYRVITLAAFVQYSFKILKQTTLTPYAGGGPALGLSPYQLYKPVYYLVSPKWYEITSTRDWGTYLIVGTNLRYSLNDCLDLMISGEFGYTALRYRFLTGTGDIREDVHHVMFLDARAGIAVKL